ncbi:hypothetical protein DFP73DRAFT_552606 [Morchella snyderi]|nr:hypothetical protein DFP73DRAFT_552606 [Morchella snyderi]
MSERLRNSWTDFLGNESPIDIDYINHMYTQSLGMGFVPNSLQETDSIDLLLQYSPIQPSTGSPFGYRPFEYSPRSSSSAPFQEAGIHSPTNSPPIYDSPPIYNSPHGLEHFTTDSSSPPRVPATLNTSHSSPKYHCNIRSCRNRSGFTSLKSRLVHARKVHKTHFFCSCPECPWMHMYRSFPTKEALDEHWRVHHPNVNHFRCSECSYTTDNVTNIQLKHLNVHFKEEGDISEAMRRIRREKEERRGQRRGQVEGN